MQYKTIILASLLVLSGTTHAEEDGAAGATRVAGSQTPASEYRADCIELAIADELPDDQMPQFIAECIDALRAEREPASGDGGD